MTAHRISDMLRRCNGWRRLAAPLLALLLAAVPLGLAASYQFTDVPASNAYHGDIGAVPRRGL